jgi:hypothetical protein
VEARGPVHDIAEALKGIDGVVSVKTESMADGVTLFEVLTRDLRDVREAVATLMAKHGWALRRLDLRRRKLQDRWSEITGKEVTTLGAAPARDGASDRTAVKTSV